MMVTLHMSRISLHDAVGLTPRPDSHRLEYRPYRLHDFLQHITKEVYSFITAEERRARLILREKILIAVEKVTGKKIQPEEAS